MTAHRIIANSNPMERNLGIQPMSREDREFWELRSAGRAEHRQARIGATLGLAAAIGLVVAVYFAGEALWGMVG